MTFPTEAMAFYRDLEADNSREFWLANKPRYDGDVRGPIEQVVALLAEEFGEAKVFRPNRDVRFAANKAPYKTHQGAYVATGPACGFYMEVSADEAIVGGGFYRAEPDALARLRRAIADEEGAQLQALVDSLTADGWIVSGDAVRTAPRGYTRDHPRIGLLRHRSLSAMQEVTAEGIEPFAREVAEGWRRVAPYVDWLSRRLRD